MMSNYNFDLPPLRYDVDEIATESFLTDFVKNIFSFGKVDEKTKYTELTSFKDMLVEPQNLFGKAPETAQIFFTLKPVVVDKKKNIISIQRINFQLLFKHILDTYGEKKLNTIFYRTYDGSDIKKFNRKKIKRGDMKITSLITPMFFALELAILFSQLYKKYRLKSYRLIATTIYNDSWLHEADNKTPGRVDINYAKSLLNPKYQLKPYQEEFIEAYPKWRAKLNLRGVYNAFDQGLGKTLTAMSLAMALHIDKIYVVCPNTLVPNWYNEVLDYYDGKIKPFDCKGTNPDKDTRVFITNNESIKNILPYIDNTCRTMLIVDEGHNFRNLNSSRVKELLDLRKRLKPIHVLPMSGTPLKASPNELVPAFLLLDPLFTPEAADIYNRCFNFDNYQAMEIITARLGKVIYRKMKSDVLTLPNKTIEDMRIKINNPDDYLLANVRKAVMEEYDRVFPSVIDKNISILKDFQTWVNKYSTAGQLATRWYINKICQAADTNTDYSIEQLHELDAEKVTTFLSTYVFSNPSFPSKMEKTILEWESKLIHFDKVAMGKAIGKIYPPRRTALFNTLWDENESFFLDMINNNIKKTVIFSQFYGVITHIKNRLEMNGINTVTINGKVSNAVRAKNLRDFKHDDDIRVIIATSQSMGTGVTLTEASQMLFFGPPWRSTDYDQCCDRIYRIGQDEDVFIYNVILDTPQLNLSSKMDKILKWSAEMFHSAIDSTVVTEDATESYIDMNNDIEALEGFLFNETPLFLNYDKWLNGKNKVLYITGLSGSGKGYQAKKIADKIDNCVIFELDKFENYMWFLDNSDKEHTAVAKGDKIIFNYLDSKYDLTNDIFDNNVEKYKLMMKEFYSFLLDYIEKHPENHYIMEGIQLYCDDAFESINNNDSVIILRTSMVKSMQRVMNRNHCEIRNHLHTFINFKERLVEFEKRLNVGKVSIATEGFSKDNKFTTPEELSEWMKANIRYSPFVRLKNPMNILIDKRGSCHDQTVFARFFLMQMGIRANAMFFIESNSLGQGGITHSFVYYKKDDKYYWFENAWSPKAGIHEYDSLKAIHDDIKNMHKNGEWGNYKKYPIVEFKSFIYQINDTLQMMINRMFRPM